MRTLVDVPSLFYGVKALILAVMMSSVSPVIHAGEPLNIFVSVLPQQFFVERIGGEWVNVEVMVKPGFSPATYESSPRQISSLAKAVLYFRVGVPFEEAWMKRIQAVNPTMAVVDSREGVHLLEIAHHDHDHAHSEGDSHDDESKVLDPHIWTSPQIAVSMATQIRDELVKLSPAQASVFTTNHARLVEALQSLDDELKALFSASSERKFMVFHPSWGYFAESYGLRQIAIEFEGKEPGARALSDLIKQAKKEQVKTIFVQPQFDARAAKQVARAIGGNVVAIDPLAADYVENLRKAARLIAGVSDE